MTEIGLSARLHQPYEATLSLVTEALKVEGFGVLTSIDVQQTMKKKLNVGFKKYTILGACNPPLAHKALSLRPEIGLLLPCNVIVYKDGDETIVNIIDPLSMLQSIQDSGLEPVAEEAYRRLKRVQAALQSQSQLESADSVQSSS